jgi:hypothetical protein
MSTSLEFVNLSEGETAENVVGRGFPGDYNIIVEMPRLERSSPRAARRLESGVVARCIWH